MSGPTPQQLGAAAFRSYMNEASDAALAESLGISRMTLHRWRQRPEYAAARVACSLLGDHLLRWHLDELERQTSELRRDNFDLMMFGKPVRRQRAARGVTNRTG